jgi:5-methyltetrahydrofolate--homocysteine methyltransferase
MMGVVLAAGCLHYKEYLEVGGSDLIGTNTFSSTTIAMADYEMENYVYELNYVGARIGS